MYTWYYKNPIYASSGALFLQKNCENSNSIQFFFYCIQYSAKLKQPPKNGNLLRSIKIVNGKIIFRKLTSFSIEGSYHMLLTLKENSK